MRQKLQLKIEQVTETDVPVSPNTKILTTQNNSQLFSTCPTADGWDNVEQHLNKLFWISELSNGTDTSA